MRFPEYPTLSREEMNDLLIKSHNGDDLAREKLIEYNLKLVMKIVKKYAKKETDYDDFFSDGVYGLIKAIDTFDISKIGSVAFSTYSTICIKNEILMEIRTNNRNVNNLASFQDVIATSKSNDDVKTLEEILPTEEPSLISCIIKEENYKKLYKALENLPEREQTLIKQKYGLTSWEDIKDLDKFSESFGNPYAGLKDKEVAKIIHTGRCNTSILHRHALDSLYNELSSLGISQK